MKFEWDDVKNTANFRKHGIWFEEAQTIWADRRAVEFFDQIHSLDEDRFIRIGMSQSLKVILVVFCEKSDQQTIRIISCRKTTNREVVQYEKGI